MAVRSTVAAERKFDKFIDNSLVGMEVEDVPGIGTISAENMQRKGIDSATQIFGHFLALRGDQHEFKGWLLMVCGSSIDALNSHTVFQAMARKLEYITHLCRNFWTVYRSARERARI